MAVERTEIRGNGGSPRRPGVRFEEEQAIGPLFRQLSADAGQLVRQEIALGKAELREAATGLIRDGAKIGVAAAFGLLAAIALTAFLIIGIGDLIDNYWLSALGVCVLYLIIAAILAKSAINGISSRDLKPTRTIETLREDAEWAKREVDEVKRELTD